MKTSNVNQGRAHPEAIIRGWVSNKRAGPTGITFGDGTHAVPDIIELTVDGGTIVFTEDGKALLIVDSSPIPTTPDATVTLYVDAATGDDSTGDGSSGAPYASIGRAIEDIPGIVTGRYVVDVADGTYYEEVDLGRFIFPHYGTDATPAYILLDGNTTTPGNVVISGASSGATTTPIRDFCIHAGGNGYFVVQGFRLQYASVRGLQADGYTAINLGKMEYDHCGDGLFLGTYTVCYLLGDQTFSNVAKGIYLTEFSRLNTDAGSRAIAMTGITDRGLYAVESTVLLNAGDSLSIAPAGSGTRTAGIESDGAAVIDIPVTVSVTGAFAYSIVAGGNSDIHVNASTLTVSGASTGSYNASDMSSIYDVNTGTFLAVGISLTGLGGAPSTADYLVGTAQAGLSAEIVVGTTPGGELGGTWASPTVDTTHSGSSHAGVIATHEAASDPHTGYVREADANWIDLTDGGSTTLHTHSGASSQHILLADGRATPFTFNDLLQMDDGSDFMWSD